VIILGSTGSIGTQTLDVIDHLNRTGEGAIEVVGLVGGANAALIQAQADHFRVRHVVAGRTEPGVIGTIGDPAERLVRAVECDVVVSAISGAAGLRATLAAAELGRDIALANKETLVAAGALITAACRTSGSRLLPVDSEHSALWQCLQGSTAAAPPYALGTDVARLILTASGGALRDWPRQRAYHASPTEALAHPTWTMGAKVTLDSASLTNKAFEVIEAHWLFGIPAERIDVLIHPQSIVHSLVEFADGSVLAQLGSPDMRGPIQYALTHPARASRRARSLDLAAMSRLDFSPPDLERFPALGLAYRVIREGGTSGAIFNAASEEATAIFLAHGSPATGPPNGAAASSPGPRETNHAEPASAAAATATRPITSRVAFGQIPELAAAAMDALGVKPVRTLGDVLEADAAARRFVRGRVGGREG
jgi:1-deoxy-D-xylulose-5-phosphate reductoisomerase